MTARFGCLPCQHTSARTPFDQNTTLWASWSIESGGKKVWFGGDTGYRSVPQLPEGVDDYGPDQNHPRCPAFKQIGDLRGPFDLGLIPIGAYAPRWVRFVAVVSSYLAIAQDTSHTSTQYPKNRDTDFRFINRSSRICTLIQSMLLTSSKTRSVGGQWASTGVHGF